MRLHAPRLAKAGTRMDWMKLAAWTPEELKRIEQMRKKRDAEVAAGYPRESFRDRGARSMAQRRRREMERQHDPNA